MFALGICFYLFHRPEDHAKKYLDSKFARKNPLIAEANKRAIDAGYNFAANTHQFANTYAVPAAPLEKGTYRSINGNVATAWGLMAALLRLLPHHAGHGDSRRAGQTQGAGREDRAGRRRDRRHLHGHRRRLRRQFRRHDDLRPGTFAQKRSARSGRHGRTAAGGGRRPARRPVDGSADQDRTERPDAGALRPQRRVSRGGARSLDARRLLPFRFRSG